MLAWDGSIGRQKCCDIGLVSPAYSVFEFDKGIDLNWVEYLLKTPRAVQKYRVASRGTNVRRKKLPFEDFAALEFPVPPILEQQKIAEILGSIDGAIAATRRVIEQTRNLKRALMQDLLTRGIPARHIRFKDSALGPVPTQWQVRRAIDLCSRISVGIVVEPSKHYRNEGISCLRPLNVGENEIKHTDMIFISEESNHLHRKSQLREGDVLIVRSGYPGTACVVTPEFAGANCVDVVIASPKRDIIDSRYLCQFINSDVGRGHVLDKQVGGAQQHFNVGHMKVMDVAVPTLQEQIQILAIIELIDRRLTLEQQMLAALEQQAKATSAALLSGEIRVPVVTLRELAHERSMSGG